MVSWDDFLAQDGEESGADDSAAGAEHESAEAYEVYEAEIEAEIEAQTAIDIQDLI